MKSFGHIVFMASLLALAGWTLGRDLVPMQISIDIELSSPERETLEVFWRVRGDDYSAKNSQSRRLLSGRQKFSFSISALPSHFRIDPFAKGGVAKIYSICFRKLLANSCITGGPELTEAITWKNVDQVASAETALHIKTSSVDPIGTMTVPSQYFFRARFFNTLGLALLALALAAILDLILFSPKKFTAQYFPQLLVRLSVLAFAICGLVLVSLWAPVLDWIRGPKAPSPFSTEGHSAMLEYFVDGQGHLLSQPKGNLALLVDPFAVYRNYPGQTFKGLTTGATGFRGADRPSQSARPWALVLGGSTAFGWRLEQDRDTPDQQLERLLPFQFINMAAAGYHVAQEAAVLFQYGLERKPQLIVTITGVNDFHEYFIKAQKSNPEVVSVYEGFIWRLKENLREKIGSLENKDLTPVPSVSPRLISRVELVDQVTRGFLKMKFIAKALNSRLVIVLQPILGGLPQKTPQEEAALAHFEKFLRQSAHQYTSQYLRFTQDVSKQCLRLELTCLNLMDDFTWAKGRKESDLGADIFADLAHLAPLGNRLLAEKISKVIQGESQQ